MHPNTNIGISKRKAIWNSQHFCQIRFGFCAFLKRILKAYDGCCKSLREFTHLSEISNKQTNVGSFVVKHSNYFLKFFIAGRESAQNWFDISLDILLLDMKWRKKWRKYSATITFVLWRTMVHYLKNDIPYILVFRMITLWLLYFMMV